VLLFYVIAFSNKSPFGGFRGSCGKDRINRNPRNCLAALFVTAILAASSFAHPGHDAAKTPAPVTAIDSIKVAQPAVDTSSDSGAVGVDEKLGGRVPLDAPLVNEKGETVTLGSLIQGPTILSIVYYKCTNECGALLTGMASALRTFADDPRTAPNVITMSVDESETTADAAKARSIAFEAIEKPYPADRWRFLTGPEKSITRITTAVGFRFVKKADDVDHPLCLIVLSPDGRIVRYIMGTEFLPMDISMSLMEASKGAIQPTIARVLRVCFSYDPKSHRFVFNILKVSATVIFTLLGVFIVYLIVSGHKRKMRASRR
jgi:protein SCO1/2